MSLSEGRVLGSRWRLDDGVALWWLTYLRGTIDSLTVLGKSLVVGRRPGMVARLCRAVEGDNLFFVCFLVRRRALLRRTKVHRTRLEADRAPSGGLKLVVACQCFVLLGPASERSRSSAGS